MDVVRMRSNYKKGQNSCQQGQPSQQKQGYCPFRTPIIQPRPLNSHVPTKSCRVLFEDDEPSVLSSLDINMLQNDENNINDGLIGFEKLIGKNKQKHNGLLPSRQIKENSRFQQPFGFNNYMKLKYPQTPIFKKHMQSPISQFNRIFHSKTQLLKNQLKRKISINPLDCTANPLQFGQNGYKFFICIAQFYKKIQAVTQCRLFYKISVYMQPYDQAIWEWILKFEEELGNLEKAYELCKTAVMFLKNQNFILKYLKLADKCDKPISQIRGVLGQTYLKFQVSAKIYLQLARIDYKFGNIEAAYKICYYINQQNEGNSNIILEMCRILQCGGYINMAINLLYKAIQKGSKAYSVYSNYLKLIESIYICPNDHLEFILNKAQKTLPQQVFWKIVLDVSRHYLITEQKQSYVYLIRKALELAPANAKFKPYTIILKLIDKPLLNPKNSLMAIQCNKQGLLSGKMTPYNFGQWKHYLHFSIFYIFYGIQEARTKLQEATLRWPYAGRLWAQILWMMRVSKEQSFEKWKQVILQVPKSGQVWCEGGRILADLGDLDSALFCFEAAMHLTPQYGDSFIQAMKILMYRGKYKEMKVLKRKLLNVEPFYGNVWCFLKNHPRSSAIQIYRKAKCSISQQLYRCSGRLNRHLTAIEQYNCLFEHPERVSQVMKEKIICAYDQLQNTRS